MSASQTSSDDKVFMNRTVEAAIRIGLIVLLVAWSFQIVRPFIVPVIWGIIIAIATHPAYRRLVAVLGGRRGLASAIFTILFLVLIIGPAVLLAGTMVDTARVLAQDMSEGTLKVPPPPESVATWPVVGEPLSSFWGLASVNLEAALGKIAPELAAVGKWLLAAAAGAGFGILLFIFAVIIAGVLLAHAGAGRDASYAIATRLAGERGADYADLAQATVRSVARGILGVAIIQSLLAGLGFLAVGIPGAGLLALLCLLLAVVQIGPGLVLIAVVIYVFSTAETLTAVLFAVWCVFVGLLDNVLKPLLLGRGVRVPMTVIFVGAIGGFIASGIIGLFVGAVVLALGFTLFQAWVHEHKQALAEDAGAQAPGPGAPAPGGSAP